MLMRTDRPDVIKFPPRHLPTPLPLPEPTNGVDQATFALLDGDGDGKISKDEWKRSGWTDDRQKLFDADGDGNVSEKEFTETRRYEREFNDKDENGDGSLTRRELNGFNLGLNPFPIDRPWFAKLADKAGLKDVLAAGKGAAEEAGDKLSDGLKCIIKPDFPVLKDRFGRFDADGDGKVSKEEYVAGRRKERLPHVPTGPIFFDGFKHEIPVRADVAKPRKKEITNGTDTLKLSSQDDQ
jgi:Ca2+-binding EF-hand superfamily protein